MTDHHPFDADTAVVGSGPRFDATITDRWSVGAHANGGYVLSALVAQSRQLALLG